MSNSAITVTGQVNNAVSQVTANAPLDATPSTGNVVISLDGIVDGEHGGTGIDNTGKTITLGGDFETSGAFDVTLTATATTNVTLPTTGTISEVLLATSDLSGQSEAVVTGLSTTYHSYRIEIANVVPVTNNVFLYYQTSSNNGVAWDSGASDYQFSSLLSRAVASDTTYIRSSAANVIQIGNNYSNTASSGNNIVINLFMPATSLIYNGPLFRAMYLDVTLGLSCVTGQGNRVATQVNNACRLYFSSGNFSTGIMKVYGILA